MKKLSLAISSLASTSFCPIVFLFCLHFCRLSHFEIIRCIVKSLITTLTYFLFKYNWRNKTWKLLFWCQSLGSQTIIPVSQMARKLPSTYQWNILLKYWSLKHYQLIVESSFYFAWTWNAYYVENKKLESS